MGSQSRQRFRFRSRTLLVIGITVMVVAIVGAICLCIWGETFFSLTRPRPADVLIVEGWIGSEGVGAAANEFRNGNYKYVVATGGLTSYRIDNHHLNYAEMAKEELIRSGVPDSRIILASIGGIEHERTFKSAAASRESLYHAGVRPAAVNVFTLGPHARRSRLVYAKVYASEAPVGVFAFIPSGYRSMPWWASGARTRCLLKEVVGYPFELLLNSGRLSNSPASVPCQVAEHAVAAANEHSHREQ